jgi:protein-L-isoaspartate(D-aspartate) O-methyltransferase
MNAGARLAGIGMTSQRTRDRMIERLRAQGIRDERVLAAMAAVPRHVFIDEALASRAYEDTALPIGFGQTISQPYVVARMIAALREPAASSSTGTSREVASAQRALGKVLEVGTGCGYQAAVLSHVASEVYSIERIHGLLERARSNLRGLKLSNLRLVYGDGYQGLEKAAPFDAIIVAAAAPLVPEALRAQLAIGGRLILPVRVAGADPGTQRLLRIERGARGYTETELDWVRFVPLEAGKA